MNAMRVLGAGAALAMVIAATGCSGMPHKDAAATLALYQRHAGPPVSHVLYTGLGRGFEVIDDSHLLLDGGPARTYLLTLGGSCLAYDRNGVFLGIDSLEDGQINAGFDSVVLLREPRLRCSIRAIQPVDLRSVRAEGGKTYY